MKVSEIYVKTLKFVWMKLGLGLLKVVLSIILLAICFGLAALFNSDGALGILILVWLGGTAFLSSVLTHYIGYLVKAGHIAVVSHAISTGQLPENQFETTKQIKTASIDSYMMIKMMVSYLEVAPQTQITFDLYDKLCKLSKKFKELFTKGTNDSDSTVTA